MFGAQWAPFLFIPTTHPHPTLPLRYTILSHKSDLVTRGNCGVPSRSLAPTGRRPGKSVSRRLRFLTPQPRRVIGDAPHPHTPRSMKWLLAVNYRSDLGKKNKINNNNCVSHYLMRMSSVIALTTKRTSAFKRAHPGSLKGRCGRGRDFSGLNRHLRRSFSGKVTLQRCPFQTPSSPSTAKCVLLLIGLWVLEGRITSRPK